MSDVWLVPEQKQPHLIGWEIAMIWFIVEDVTSKAKRSIVVKIGFQMRDPLDVFSNPHNERG
jgi:hypothetical protein